MKIIFAFALFFLLSGYALAFTSTASVTNVAPTINSIRTFSSYTNFTVNTPATDFSTYNDIAVVYMQINVSDANSYVDIKNVSVRIVLWDSYAQSESSWSRFGSDYNLNATFESGNGTTAIYTANFTMLSTDPSRRGALYYRVKAQVNDGVNSTTSNTSSEQNANFNFAKLSVAVGGGATVMPAVIKEEVVGEENITEEIINVTEPLPEEEEITLSESYSSNVLADENTIKSYIEESWLPGTAMEKKAFEALFEKTLAATTAVAQKLDVSRTLDVIENRSTISLKIKYSGERAAHNFIVYDELPKSIATSAGEVSITAVGADVSVVEQDPIFMFSYKKLQPSQEIVISYNINKKIDNAMFNSIPAPRIIAEKIEGKPTSLTALWLITPLIILSVLIWKKQNDKKFKYEFERKSLQDELNEIKAKVLNLKKDT